MKSRREFLKISALGTGALAIGACADAKEEFGQAQQSDKKSTDSAVIQVNKPIVISTWKNGLKANEGAWEVLAKGGYALDAVEQGVQVSELDPDEMSVGYGGRPDREGNVTLDASIMTEDFRSGAVAFLESIKTPISVARKVMEETDHVMLVGSGAQKFALEQGFELNNLLTPKAEKEWKEWLKESNYAPEINIENHDTIGMLALDETGRICGGCTTSGAAYKLNGRVGDSPIIGAGLYVDGEIGGACATGLGEAVIRTCGSHRVVQNMKHGMHPEEACKEAIEHIKKVHKSVEGMQVGFLAMNLNGEVGGYSMYDGFNFAQYDKGKGNRLVECESILEW